MLGLLVSYKNKQNLKDDYGQEIMMFFNENFIDEIISFLSSYKYSSYCKISKKDKTVFNKNGLLSIKNTLSFYKENFKLNIIKFVEYGQRRGKNWDYITIEQYNEAKNIIPKPKKKFINPKKRKKYVTPKQQTDRGRNTNNKN